MELAAAISVQSDQIKLKVSKGDVSSEISQEAGKVSIKANRFSLESDNLTIAEDGTINAKNGNFEGTIKSRNAYITGGQIKISTAAQTYDTIELKYRTKKTNIASDYIYLEENSSKHCQITSFQLSMIDSGNSFFANSGSITLNRSGKTTGIQGDSAVFGGDISVLGKGESYFSGKLSVHGNFSVSGDIVSPKNKFMYAVENEGTGSLTLDAGSSFTCRGKAEFYNGINGGTVFSLSATGDFETNGSIKSTGLHVSEMYSLNLKNNLSVDGAVTIKGSTKIGDSTGDSLGFFGSNGSGKRNVSTITTTSSATSSSNALKINEIINALKAYNLL